ncbi:ParB/RepB/Spo0J family partition protein [Caballeronia sp. LZ001]|uniref:ParB/RepB/Spo0J family partition protein n=1 Tax=Caballeronia sp. LZ001 TaxID=3038553 RepID=UPI002859C777|nr:ParB/RepB/Spo0J family partition protein [Caballeronia sp. LZ001]MDR5805265.1 ParB/RepB/Spo0J family partition protein [Caballeronia sp. LZ001]
MSIQSTEQGVLELVAGNVKQVVAPYRQGSVDIYMVSLDAIRLRPGFNDARSSDPEYAQHVRELADSIKANGFYRHKPLTVLAAADGFLYLSDGHSRFAALQLANEEGANIEAVPVVNEARGTTDEDRIVGLITNNSGKRLTPYGEGLVCKTLIGRGLSEKEISRRTGFPLAKVLNVLSLVGAPKPIRDMVTSGKVSATTAIKTMRQHGTGAVAALEKGVKRASEAGKSKVMPRMVERSNPIESAVESIADAARLDWLGTQCGDVRIRFAGRGTQLPKHIEIIRVHDDVCIGKGADLRAALDAARDASRDAS